MVCENLLIKSEQFSAPPPTEITFKQDKQHDKITFQVWVYANFDQTAQLLEIKSVWTNL